MGRCFTSGTEVRNISSTTSDKVIRKVSRLTGTSNTSIRRLASLIAGLFLFPLFNPHPISVSLQTPIDIFILKHTRSLRWYHFVVSVPVPACFVPTSISVFFQRQTRPRGRRSPAEPFAEIKR